MDRVPPDIKDIYRYVSSVPFGEINFLVNRKNRKTVEIITVTQETLKYVNNEEAKTDFNSFIDGLISSGYSGEANIKLEMKDGNIHLVGIINKKTTKY